jgi:hypothetical protein
MYNRRVNTLLVITTFIYLVSSVYPEKVLELNSEEKQIRRDKLKKFNRETFVNRSNEKADEETKKNDLETGKKIALLQSSNETETFVRGVRIKRYEIKEDGKFGGDILEFSDSVSFGHINTIVRIVTGYIKENYSYTMEDSELLALYMVYYNLKHRQDDSYFLKSFSNPLTSNISKEKIGLDENFEEWKGQTQFIIPLEKNVLKNGGLDIATFEIEDQVNSELDFQKDGGETKKKYNNLQTKKIKVEKEESEKKLISAKNREVEIIEKKKSTEDKLTELSKDPEKYKAEIEKLETEKNKQTEEISKLETEKKQFANKAVQVTQREEMRKVGITNEEDYKEAVKNKKLPEVYYDPSTLEVKTKGTTSIDGTKGISGLGLKDKSTSLNSSGTAQTDKNKQPEIYSGSANSVGIPKWKNKSVASEKDGERADKEYLNQMGGDSNQEIGSTTSYGKNKQLGTEINNKFDQNSTANSNKSQSLNNPNLNGSTSSLNSDSNALNKYNNKNSYTNELAANNINSQNTSLPNNNQNSIEVSNNSGTKNDNKIKVNNSSSVSPKITNPSNNANSPDYLGKNSENLNLNGTSGNKISKNGLNVVQKKDGQQSETVRGETQAEIEASKGILKYAEEPKKKIIVKIVNDYNVAFRLGQLNIAAREFIKGGSTGFLVIGKKLPVKSDDLSLFLLDAQNFDIKATANNVILHKNSPFLYYYEKIIVYEKFKDSVYLTQFNMNLDFEMRSPEPIDPDTNITIEGDLVTLLKYVPEDKTFKTINYNRKDFTKIAE